jgi:preprotein translocase SecE subunit
VAKAVNSGRGAQGGAVRRAPLPPPSGQRTTVRRFVAESIAELRKVQWPTRAQVVQGTLVVGFVTLVFGIYLTIVDTAASRIVQQIDTWIT